MRLPLFVFQSDTASVEIPELELELSSGTLGGLVTTVEGLLTNISQSKLLLENIDNLIISEILH